MASTSAKSVAEQVVDTQRALAGPHPGFRPVHAKGIVCTGTFLATTQAKEISRAAHFQGDSVPAITRFSNSSGDPNIHDGLPGVRALSVKFLLPGGGKTDILANSIEGFAARTPEEFLAFLQANLPDPATGKPNPDAVPAFLQSHPAAKAFIDRLMQRPIPASYAQASYHAVHAFRFSAADGSQRLGRYRWSPKANESFLSPTEAGKRDANFLLAELTQRLAKGPAEFRLDLQLAQDEDPTDDATALWPANRLFVALGRLHIDAISATGADDERRLVFDPTNLTDGIELTADPIPRVRSEAYSISFDRRSQGL